MKELNSVTELNTLVAQEKPILLDFFEIRKVNVDQQPELAQQFRVRSIPALFFIKNGKVIDQLQGNQPQSVLQEKINKYSAN